MADAGWYPDPQRPGTESFWDGAQWTGQTRSAESAAPDGHPAADPSNTTQIFTPIKPADLGQAPPPWQTDPYSPTAQPAAPEQPWPGYGQPQYGQQYGQPQYGTPYGGQPGGAAPATKRRTGLIVGAAAAAVVLAGGVAAFALWPSDSSSPSITYQGKEIKNAAAVLTRAEKAVTTSVTARHGAKSSDTRCYFSVPKTPEQGSKKTDVDSSLYCGPVLFLGGDTSSQYLQLSLTNNAASGAAELEAAAPSSGDAPVARPTDSTLERPDGKTAPKGAGGLKVPTPPPAAPNLLTTLDGLGSTSSPKTLSNVTMIGASTGVQLDAAGVISSYGSGDAMRSAASGQELVAFQYSYIGGDLTQDNTAAVRLVTRGSSGAPTSRSVPNPASSSSWIVASVPKSTGAELQLTDGGVTQTLSLPSGKAGASNLQVLSRQNRDLDLDGTGNATIQFKDTSRNVTASVPIVLDAARLGYWVRTNVKVHASSGGKGVLTVSITFTDPTSHNSYGVPSGLLQLKLPGGRTIQARNVSADSANKILIGFTDVPADMTRASVVVTGTTISGRIRYIVKKSLTLPIAFPAG